MGTTASKLTTEVDERGSSRPTSGALRKCGNPYAILIRPCIAHGSLREMIERTLSGWVLEKPNGAMRRSEVVRGKARVGTHQETLRRSVLSQEQSNWMAAKVLIKLSPEWSTKIASDKREHRCERPASVHIAVKSP